MATGKKASGDKKTRGKQDTFNSPTMIRERAENDNKTTDPRKAPPGKGPRNSRPRR